MYRKLDLNRDVSLEVGLLVWVLLKGSPWTPARIIDRQRHESKIVQKKHHVIPKPSHTNSMVQYFLEKNVSVLENEFICDYTNNMHLVHQSGKARRDIVRACVEANKYLNTNPNAVASQVKRFRALESFDVYMKRTTGNLRKRSTDNEECIAKARDGRADPRELGKRRHSNTTEEEWNKTWKKRSKTSCDDTTQRRVRVTRGEEVNSGTRAPNVVVKDGHVQYGAELAVAKVELRKMREELVARIAHEEEWRKDIERCKSAENANRLKEEAMVREVDKMRVQFVERSAKEEELRKNLESMRHENGAQLHKERELLKKIGIMKEQSRRDETMRENFRKEMEKLIEQLEMVKSERESERKEVERIGEEKEIRMEGMEREIKLMGNMKIELRILREEKKKLQDILEFERDEWKREVRKRREEKHKLQDSLRDTEKRLKKKRKEIRNLEEKVDLQRDEIKVMKEELQVDQIYVKEEEVLDQGDKFRKEIRWANEQAEIYKSMVKGQEQELDAMKTDLMMEREKRKMQEKLLNTFLEQKNTIDTLKHQLNATGTAPLLLSPRNCTLN